MINHAGLSHFGYYSAIIKSNNNIYKDYNNKKMHEIGKLQSNLKNTYILFYIKE